MADIFISSPSGDIYTSSPSGDTYVWPTDPDMTGALILNETTLIGRYNIGGTETVFSGALDLSAAPTVVGTIGEGTPQEFSGTLLLESTTLSAFVSAVQYFNTYDGPLLLPDPNERNLISDPTGDQYVSDPSGDDYVLPGLISGSFEISWSFSGALVLEPTTLTGVSSVVRDFSGALILNSATLSGTTVIDRVFTGALTTKKTRVNGVYTSSQPFSGALTLPEVTIDAVDGLDSPAFDTLITFMNLNPSDFSNSAFNTYLQKYWPTYGATAGPFDNTNALTGDPIFSASFENRTVTPRFPDFNSRRQLTIDPQVQVAWSGKVRTYVVNPVLHRVTFTWKLLGCNDEDILNIFLGLLYMSEVHFVYRGETFQGVLVDDILTLLDEARNRSEITLNFEGKFL